MNSFIITSEASEADLAGPISTLCHWLNMRRIISRALAALVLVSLHSPVGSPAATTQTIELTKLTADDADPGDTLGDALGVSEDGNLVAAGVQWDDDRGQQAGAVILFERPSNASSWSIQRKLFAYDTAAADQFGRRIALSGDLLAVATMNPSGPTGTGTTYIFERNRGGTNNWGEATRKTTGLADRFSGSISLWGTTLAVTAARDDDGSMDSGACYVFERHLGGADNWGLAKKLKAPDAEENDRFGANTGIVIKEEILVVGAKFEDTRGSDAGAVYIFGRDTGGPNNWGMVKKLAPDALSDGDQFGITVDVDNDILVASSVFDDAVAPDAGAVYVFERNSGGSDNWGFIKALRPADGTANLNFGRTLALQDDLLAVGAFGSIEFEGGWIAGVVYLFKRDHGGPNNWGQVGKLNAPPHGSGDPPAFGSGLSLKNGLLAVGSIFDGEAAYRAGAVQLFQVFDQPSLAIMESQAGCTVSWPSIPNVLYVLEQTPSLPSADWQPVYIGTNHTFDINHDTPSSFLRLKVQ